jgi:formamidopyrimidine-DNA glycosylase
MIELPEAVVIARQVGETVRGKEITGVVANASPHKFAWYTGDPARYDDLLAGKIIGGASAFGNHVEIEVGDKILAISTPIKYHAQGENPPKKHQLLLEFSDKTALSCTVQMWGAMLCLDMDGQGGMPDYQTARERPSPLSEAFDRAYFDTLLDADTLTLSAKAFLATEQRIPGLGNGVLQDILWTAHVHPKRKMGELSEQEIQDVFEAVRQVLSAMTAQGGRDTERDLFGRPGGYKTVLSKNTVGGPCPACGAIIKKEAYLGGTIYYCPGCQQL